MQERTHCGDENVIDDRPREGEDPSHEPDAAVPNPPPAEVRAANSRRSTPFLIGAGAGAFAITFWLLIAGSHQPRTDLQAVNAGQTMPGRADSDAPATGERTPRPTWVGRRQPGWATDGTRTITFALDAINDMPLSMRGARPQLVTRCLSGTIDVYVVTGPLGVEGDAENHTVHVRLDDGPEESQHWSDSESGQELFSPDGLALTDRLAHAHRLRFGFTPFAAVPVTADFAVDGFDELASLLVRTCGRHLSAAAKKRS